MRELSVAERRYQAVLAVAEKLGVPLLALPLLRRQTTNPSSHGETNRSMCLIKMRRLKPIPVDHVMINVVLGVSTSLPSIDLKAATIDALEGCCRKGALTRELWNEGR